MPPRILLADDSALVRQGVRTLLEREGLEIVAEAADGHEAMRLARELQPDIAVLDFDMPLLNGIGAARAIRRVSPRTRSILLTRHVEKRCVLEALRVGVKGYVLETEGAAELLQAIQEVSQGAIHLSPPVSGVVVEAYLGSTESPADPLTPRQKEVLQLVAEGKTTKEVATLLGMSVKTAESHRARIMQKLEIHQTAGLVRYAIREGLIQP
jgi:DNA-binding NarL/FixJ family response regulator